MGKFSVPGVDPNRVRQSDVHRRGYHGHVRSRVPWNGREQREQRFTPDPRCTRQPLEREESKLPNSAEPKPVRDGTAGITFATDQSALLPTQTEIIHDLNTGSNANREVASASYLNFKSSATTADLITDLRVVVVYRVGSELQSLGKFTPGIKARQFTIPTAQASRTAAVHLGKFTGRRLDQGRPVPPPI